MEIRKLQAAAMRHRAQNLREAACGLSSGVSRTLYELADSIDAEAALLEARAAGGSANGEEGGAASGKSGPDRVGPHPRNRRDPA
ncbi:MAG: hypothetical protein ABWX67_09260 [Allosphingosinicella sp.]